MSGIKRSSSHFMPDVTLLGIKGMVLRMQEKNDRE